ncbi:MAG TPA: hypothetical protein VIQ76_21185, partial [Propionibacteriaceae bacterium]
EQEEAAAADDISVAVETSGSEPTVPSTAAGNENSQPSEGTTESIGAIDEPSLERTEDGSS